MTSASPDETLLPFESFEETLDAWLQLLRDQLGFRLWALLRDDHGHDRVLRSLDGFGNMPPGSRLRWLRDLDSEDDAQFVLAPRFGGKVVLSTERGETEVPVRACIRIALLRPNGQPYGALCALDPREQSDELERHTPLLRAAARQLSTMLINEWASVGRQREAERRMLSIGLDAATGLFSDAAWRRMIEIEEDRCRQLGASAGMIAMRLEQMPQDQRERERLVRRIGWIVRGATEPPNLAARLDERTFGLMSIDATLTDTQALAQRLGHAFEAEQLPVRIASAERGQGPQDLATCWLWALREVI